jgi:hypothetical protein
VFIRRKQGGENKKELTLKNYDNRHLSAFMVRCTASILHKPVTFQASDLKIRVGHSFGRSADFPPLQNPSGISLVSPAAVGQVKFDIIT